MHVPHEPATPVQARTEFHDTAEIWSLAFTPDARFLAVNAPNSNDVRLWEWRGTPKIVKRCNWVGVENSGSHHLGDEVRLPRTVSAKAHGSRRFRACGRERGGTDAASTYLLSPTA